MSKATAESADALVPKMGEFPVSSSAFYQRLVLTDAADPGQGRPATPLENPLDPFGSGAGTSTFSSRPATGVLLTFEQGWYQEGLTLGELRHSLCLAPGEVTKLAVVDWRRTTRDSSAASTTQDEAVMSQADDAQAISSVQNAVAQENAQGNSTTIGIGTQMEAAASFGGLIVSGSASASQSSQLGFAATSSTGTRNVAAEASQDIDRRTTQLTQATRSRRATQVRELSEAEHQSASTRVVANYNHMHALTIQYYEVLQTYSLATKVVKAERCVFVPMTVLDFSAETLRGPGVLEALLRVAQEMGWTVLVTMLRQFAAGDDDRLATERATLTATRAHLMQVIQSAGQAQEGEARRAEADAMAERRAGRDGSAAAPNRKKLDDMASGVREYMGELVTVDARIAAIDSARAEMDRLIGVLQEHRLFISQQMWMRVDEYAWHILMGTYSYPDEPYPGEVLGSLVTPQPIGYFGNYVAFRWDFPATADGAARAEDFEKGYRRARTVESRVALPTEGVFAEAVLGQSNSAEILDITRFWNWQDSPIPILPPEMAPIELTSRARDVTAGQLDFDAAVATLRDQNLVTGGADTAAIVAALQTSLFGDRSGIDAAAGAAGQAGGHAAEGAGRAGQRTVDLTKNLQNFVVGLANSEVGKIAAQAVAARTGGISAVGGLLNSAKAAAPNGAGGGPAAGGAGDTDGTGGDPDGGAPAADVAGDDVITVH